MFINQEGLVNQLELFEKPRILILQYCFRLGVGNTRERLDGSNIKV